MCVCLCAKNRISYTTLDLQRNVIRIHIDFYKLDFLVLNFTNKVKNFLNLINTEKKTFFKETFRLSFNASKSSSSSSIWLMLVGGTPREVDLGSHAVIQRMSLGVCNAHSIVYFTCFERVCVGILVEEQHVVLPTFTFVCSLIDDDG